MVAMPKKKERGALLVAACIIAAIRLRGEEIKVRFAKLMIRFSLRSLALQEATGSPITHP
jgi:hypothetical protein